MNATFQLFAREFRKPTLNLIDPGCWSWREVDMVIWASCQPCFNLFCFVGGVVIDDDMNIKVACDPSIIMVATSLSLIERGRPGRGASQRPSRRSFWNCRRIEGLSDNDQKGSVVLCGGEHVVQDSRALQQSTTKQPTDTRVFLFQMTRACWQLMFS